MYQISSDTIYNFAFYFCKTNYQGCKCWFSRQTWWTKNIWFSQTKNANCSGHKFLKYCNINIYQLYFITNYSVQESLLDICNQNCCLKSMNIIFHSRKTNLSDSFQKKSEQNIFF